MSSKVYSLMQKIDLLVTEKRWEPWSGFDPPNPKGALQQSRTELLKFFEVLEEHDILKAGSKCLQLGLGPSGVSHPMWQLVFSQVLTIDERTCLMDDMEVSGGKDTHSSSAVKLASMCAPFDMLFIDAGHTYPDVRMDHIDYRDFVRPGGIVAFHDACKRDDIPAHMIWKFLEDEVPEAAVIDDDGIGIAWYKK